MRAIVLREFGPPENLRLEEVPAPSLRAGEALIRVGAVNVDLYQTVVRRGAAVGVELPRIIGNGIAGAVAALGPGATGPAPGTRVVVCNNASCGDCRYCRAGRDTLCVERSIVGAHRDGGYAEFVAVPARDCVELPATVPFADASLVPNTIGPVVKACSRTAGIRLAENVVVVGAGGGMGIHAVQAARACGARVIAALRSMGAAGAVREAGAEVVVSTRNPDWHAEARRLSGGWGADVVLDFVANRETLKSSMEALGPGGRLVVMGYFPRGGVLETPTWVFSEERTVTGNRSAGRRDVAAAVSLLREGRIKALVDRTFRLEDAAAAHRAVEAKEIVGRAVIVP
ncbi:MAG: zinc-binding dehydrogenase [Burkholderiales bacterium]|nr:zinc-binding dehydrogenase [Burkholderiales bacterium]